MSTLKILSPRLSILNDKQPRKRLVLGEEGGTMNKAVVRRTGGGSVMEWPTRSPNPDNDGAYISPYPLRDGSGRMLVGYGPCRNKPTTGYGIYWFDWDQRAAGDLVYDDPQRADFWPIPVQPRALPLIIPDHVMYEEALPAVVCGAGTTPEQDVFSAPKGTLHCLNVYRTSPADGLADWTQLVEKMRGKSVGMDWFNERYGKAATSVGEWIRQDEVAMVAEFLDAAKSRTGDLALKPGEPLAVESPKEQDAHLWISTKGQSTATFLLELNRELVWNHDLPCGFVGERGGRASEERGEYLPLREQNPAGRPSHRLRLPAH
jgi:hypothetical protein